MTDKQKKIVLKKAKTHKGRIHLAKQLPKVVEDPKECLFINTSNSSEIMKIALNEFYLTRKGFSNKLNRKNIITPVFDNSEHIENLTSKSNSSLFYYTSDNKKRKMNLVFGNLFNKKVLDAFEFEVSNFIPHDYFGVKLVFDETCLPVLVFMGELFETEKRLERFKLYMMDFYKQDTLDEVNITDLRRIITFTACSNDEEDNNLELKEENNKINNNFTIKIRHYQSNSISEYSIKNINLQEIGPSFDLKPRRILLAEDDQYKLACKQPKFIGGKAKSKNVNTELDVRSKLFPAKQNLNAISLRRYDKILGKKRRTTSNTNGEKIENKERKEKSQRGERREKGERRERGEKREKSETK